MKKAFFVSILCLWLILGCSLTGPSAPGTEVSDAEAQKTDSPHAESVETDAASPEAPEPGGSHDGWICFESSQDIWVMRTDGSELKNITTSESNWEIGPRLSPDASKIVYTNLEGDIYLINRNGTDRLPLVMGANAKFPSWSSDGTSIIYITIDVKGDGFVSSIHMIDIDSKVDAVIYLGKNTTIVSAAASPDGKKIAFAANGIYLINIDGSGLEQILEALPQQMIASLAWSKDSQKIAFHAGYGVIAGTESWAEHSDIYVVNADGSGLINLTNSSPGPSVTLMPGPNILIIGENPRWTYGGQIVFQYNENSGDYDCKPYIINSDGSSLELLLDQKVSSLDYQPDMP